MDLRSSARYTAALPLIAVAVSLSGCGGASHTSPGAPAAAGSTLRVLQPGDTWTYKVTGYQTGAALGTIGVTSGTYVLGVQNDLETGDKSLTHALSLTWTNGTSTTENWLEDFVQNPSTGSNPYVVSKRGDTLDNTTFGASGNFEMADPVVGIYNPTTNALIGIASYGESPLIPGVWSSTMTGLSSDDSYEEVINNKITVTNQEHFSTNVLGAASVDVPAGYFSCWDTKQIESYVAQGRTVNSEAWWAPQIGTFVKMTSTENIQYTNLTTGERVLTYTLVSTNVPH